MKKIIPALMMSAALPAMAVADAAPPALLAGEPVSWMGRNGDADIWFVPGTDFVVAEMPGGGVIAGYLYAPNGAEISSVMTGREDQLPLPELIGMARAAVAQNAETGASPEIVAPEPASPDAEAPDAGTGPEADFEPAGAADPEAALRDELLREFQERIAGASTQEEYQRILGEWRAEAKTRIDQARARNVADGLASGDVSGPGPADGATGAAAPSAAAPAPEAGGNAAAIDALIEGASRTLIGSETAPRIMAVLDPACPYCATAMTALAPRIERGEIAIDAVIVPVISERSRGLVAGILSAENPGEAMLSHEKAMRGAGGAMIEAASWEGLPRETREAVERDVGLLRAAGVPGVPFFIFDGPEGPVTRSGSLSDADVDAAIAWFESDSGQAAPEPAQTADSAAAPAPETAPAPEELPRAGTPDNSPAPTEADAAETIPAPEASE
ncbi:MAG: hypothetical protein DI629_17595 [Mesorhizobium amorphae]|nr:MAG: hypothetical protein DI629_17595 [Mesorhizobium amorphae]